jgi:hypothetical protein
MSISNDSNLLEIPEDDDALIPLPDLHRYLPVDSGVMYDLSGDGEAPPLMYVENGPVVYRVGDLRRWLSKLLYPNALELKSQSEGDQS